MSEEWNDATMFYYAYFAATLNYLESGYLQIIHTGLDRC